MKLNVIGFCGRIGSGKDFLAGLLTKMLRQEPGNVVHTVAFADALKADVMAEYGICWEDVYQRKPDHVRRLLIEKGTAGRKKNPDYWVLRLENEIKTLQYRGATHIVISDLRYENELEMIRRFGGVAFRVVAPERSARVIADKYENPEEITNHHSETTHTLFEGPDIVDVHNDKNLLPWHPGITYRADVQMMEEFLLLKVRQRM